MKYAIKSKKVSAISDGRWKPHEYQVQGMEFLLKNAGAGLFLDPGLGKTSTTLGAIKLLKEAGQIRKVLVVAPLRVAHMVWPEEVKKWTDFHGLRVVVLHGKDKDKLAKQDADIYVINPEGLGWLMTAGRFKALGVDVLVIDESSKFKNMRTQRYKCLKPVLSKFQRRWILTGTPSPNGLLDLFGQVFLMDLGRAFSPYITRYRSQYFSSAATIVRSFVDASGREQSKKVAVGWTPIPGAEEEITEKLRPYVLRMEGKDYLELPEIVETEIYVEMPKEARLIYNQIEDTLVSEVNGNLVTAASAAAVSIKCRQIASGGLYKEYEVDDVMHKANREVLHIHDEKTEALVDLIEELQGKPLLVAYEFQHSLQRIQKALGKDIPYIGGGVSPQHSLALADAWNRGEIPVLCGHPRSMGHGLNMQGAGCHVAWYDPTWDAELYEQFNCRVARQGNTNSRVMVYRLAARSSIDIAVLASLRNKIKNQNALLSALKDYAKFRPTILTGEK